MKWAGIGDDRGNYLDQTEHPRKLFPLLAKNSSRLMIGSSHEDVRLFVHLRDGIPVEWRTIPPHSECTMADYDLRGC